MIEVLDRISGAMVGLRMPSYSGITQAMQRFGQGKIAAIEAISGLLSEKYSIREARRIDAVTDQNAGKLRSQLPPSA